MKLAVFIPGRLQSERLPNKLALPVGETSLWDAACKKLAKISEYYDTYALCNDYPLIKIAEDNNVKVILRDEATCHVDGPLTYIFGDIEQMEATHLMFLNPCLFYLKEETILAALRKFESDDMDYATSVKPLKNWLFDSQGNHLNDMDYELLNTKLIDPIYQAAHCFHIFNKDNFFKDGMMLKEGLGLLPVLTEKELIDVDTQEDYSFLKFLVESGTNK